MLIQSARTKTEASSGTEDDSWVLVSDFLRHTLGRIPQYKKQEPFSTLYLV